MNHPRLDLNQAPYARYFGLLATLRTTPESWSALGCKVVSTESGDHDADETERARVAHALLIAATADDLELVRFLLDAEVHAGESACAPRRRWTGCARKSPLGGKSASAE
jgi:hypothetical protein